MHGYKTKSEILRLLGEITFIHEVYNAFNNNNKNAY